MISIALIGGTGTGKSTLAEFLCQRYRAVWLDCDKIGHRLLDREDIQLKIKNTFGESVMEEKRISRKKLGNIVFADSKELLKLNQIIHPPIMQELKDRQKEAKEMGMELCILDGALLMDVNVRQMVDMVWAVTADKSLRMERLLKGRNIAPEKAMQIMKNQISSEEYSRYADITLSTDDGVEYLAEAIEEILAKWMSPRK